MVTRRCSRSHGVLLYQHCQGANSVRCPSVVRFATTVASAAVLLGCHSNEDTAPPSIASRVPPVCHGDTGTALTVTQALAIRESRDSVTVEGYLVRSSTGCTLRGCLTERHCNTCVIAVRIAPSPREVTDIRTLPLYDSRDSYTCLSSSPERCAFDADGQHVVARGSLRFFGESVEPISLNDPQSCALLP